MYGAAVTRLFSTRGAVLGLAVATLPLSAAADLKDPDPSIMIDEVRRGSVTEVVDVPAAVVARDAETVTAPAKGQLVELKVESGDHVHAGEVIALIDSPIAQKRLARAREALQAAQEFDGIDPKSLDFLFDDIEDNAGDSFSDLRRIARLIPDEEAREAALERIDDKEEDFDEAVDDAERVVDQVQDTVEDIGDALEAINGGFVTLIAESSFDAAKAVVDALTVRAPIDGVVQLGGTSRSGLTGTGPLAELLGDKNPAGPLKVLLPAVVGPENSSGPRPGAGVDDVVEVGDPVEAGTAIVTIVDTSGPSLVGQVDETDVLLVRPGMEAGVKLDAAPRANLTASVTSVDLLPTTSARGGVAYRIRLNLIGEVTPTPLPGMSAVAHLPVGNATDALAVPAAAIFSADGQDFVWLVRDRKALKQKVLVGISGTDRRQILEGLQAGDRVIVSGVDKVREGMTVE